MSVLAEPRQTDRQAPQVQLPWWRRLRWALATMFLILVVIPIIVIAYITLTQAQVTAEEQTIAQLESVAELKTQAIDRWIVTSQESLTLILASDTNRNGFEVVVEQRDDPDGAANTYRQMNDLLTGAVASHEGVAEYFFYDVDNGTVLVASDAARVTQSVRRKPYFTSSLTQPYVQSPYYEITGELVMIVTEPVVADDGTIIGVLAARLNLDTLTAIMLERAGLGDTGETYLVSAQSNFLLTESRFEGFSRNVAYHSEGIDRALQNIEGSGLYNGYRGVSVIGVYRWIDSLQTALLSEIDEEEALQDFTATRNVIGILAIGLALAAVAVGSYVATRFSNPIEALSGTAAQFASGDLDVRAQTRQRNEIGVLASVFNDMADQLQTIVGSLEARVEARTRDLFLTLEVGQLATRIYQQADLLPLIAEYIRQQFGLYYAQVYLIDDAGRYAVLSAGTGEVGQQLLERKHRLDLRETSIVARTAQTQRPVLVANTAISDIFKPNPLLPETQSEVAIPLIVGDEVIGVLDMQATEADTFRADNLPVFEAMASQLASALRSAQAFAETQAAIASATTINRRLTTQAWESYLGRVGTGERVGYRYDLQTVEPLAALPEQDGGNGQADTLKRAVTLRNQVIGQIALVEDGERQWTPEELALVDSVAERVAQALDQFRAFDDTRAALDRVDLIMGAAGEGIYGLDRDGNVTFVNTAASAMDRFEPGELIGQHHHTLMHHTRRDGTPYPEAECPVNLTLQDGQPRTSDDELFWRKDGTSFPVELSANPIIQEGRVVGAVVSFSDITERLEARLELERLLDETRRRASEMETVAQVGTEAAASLEIENLLWDVAELTKERFDLYHAHIYLLDETGQNLVLRAGAGQPGRRMVDAGHRIAVNHERSLVSRAARTRETVVVDDVTAAEDFLPNPLLPKTRSEMAIPMVVGDQVIGVLDVQSNTVSRFTGDDVRVQSTLAAQIAVAVNNARLFAETERLLDDSQRRATEMETVAQVGAEASASLDPTKLLQDVVNLTKERFGLYHVHIYLLDNTGTTLVLTAGAGHPGQLMLDRGHSIPLAREGSLVARAARAQQAVTVNDVRQADDFLPNPLLPHTRSEMAVPMVVGRELVGVLDVQADEVSAFDEQEAQVLGTLASQIAVAVQNARLFAEQVQVAEQLREVDRLKSEFLASMSHELRTPLNSIIGYAEVLLDGIDGDLTDDMEEDVGAIHGSGKHLLNLINDILDLAKIEAGQMDLVSEALALRSLVDDMANSARVLVKNKEVQLIVDIPDDLPLIEADPLRVRQIVNNFISNAAKFTEEGNITVWAKLYDRDPNFIHIGITDSGIGMDQDQLDVIFDRFRQVDQSHTRRAGGTGLGLSITLQLIELHGGDVWVESAPGTGSTFHFTLPCAKPEAAPAETD